MIPGQFELCSLTIAPLRAHFHVSDRQTSQRNYCIHSPTHHMITYWLQLATRDPGLASRFPNLVLKFRVSTACVAPSLKPKLLNEVGRFGIVSWLGVARGFGDCTICNKIIMDESSSFGPQDHELFKHLKRYKSISYTEPFVEEKTYDFHLEKTISDWNSHAGGLHRWPLWHFSFDALQHTFSDQTFF